MKATVNKNIELISIIHYLMNYNDIVGFPLISDKKNIYTENIDNYFSAYKNHDFFNLYKVLIKKDFIFDAPIIFSYNFDFSIQESEANKIDYSNFRLSQTDFYTLLNSLKEFSNNVNYLHFYESQSQMYSEISRNIQNLMISTNINNELEDFYGYSFGDCEIIVSPLNNGNYGLKNFFKQKTASMIGLMGSIDGLNLNNFHIRFLSWHEFSHSIINPLIEEQSNIVNNYNHLYEPIKEKMQNQAYGNWEISVIEHIIRACTNLMVKKYYGDEKYKFLQEREFNNGFLYINSISNFLQSKKCDEKSNTYQLFKESLDEMMQCLTTAST